MKDKIYDFLKINRLTDLKENSKNKLQKENQLF